MPLQQVSGLTREDKIIIQVPKLYAGGSITNNPSGTNTNTAGTASAVVVQAPNGSVSPPAGYGYNIYDFEFASPIDSTGALPDVTIQFRVGEKSVDHVVLQAGYTHNQFPAAQALVGDEGHVKFSESILRILDELQRNPQRVRNAAFKVTGIKVPTDQALQVIVTSQAGWGQSAAAIQPLTMVLYTDVITPSICNQFDALMSGQGYHVARPPFGSVSGIYNAPGGSTPATIDEWPGGTNQKQNPKIYRKMTYATNGQAINTTGQFAFTNIVGIGGAANNVSTALSGNIQDLGDNYTASGNGAKAFIWEQFGLRFAGSLVGNGTYPRLWLAFLVNQKVWPEIYTHGILVSALDNPFHYGVRSPQAGGGLYVPLRSADRLLSMLDYQNGVVPVVSAENMTSIAAGDITVVKSGIQLDGTSGQAGTAV